MDEEGGTHLITRLWIWKKKKKKGDDDEDFALVVYHLTKPLFLSTHTALPVCVCVSDDRAVPTTFISSLGGGGSGDDKKNTTITKRGKVKIGQRQKKQHSGDNHSVVSHKAQLLHVSPKSFSVRRL